MLLLHSMAISSTGIFLPEEKSRASIFCFSSSILCKPEQIAFLLYMILLCQFIQKLPGLVCRKPHKRGQLLVAHLPHIQKNLYGICEGGMQVFFQKVVLAAQLLG